VTAIETDRYRLELGRDGARARFVSRANDHWLTLSLLAALDTADAPDETLSVAPPRVDGRTIEVERTSTGWDRAGTTIVCGDDGLEVRTWVEGRGDLVDVHLLGGRSLLAGPGTGFYPTGSSFRTLFSSNPGDPGKLVRSAGDTAVIGVSGDGGLGRGHWFFTPAPLFLALTTADVRDPAQPVDEGWLGIGVAAPVAELGFVQLVYQPGDRAFNLVLEYEGHTSVDGRFEAPTVILAPGLANPYAGLRAHRDDLAARGAASPPDPRQPPAWWSEPMFCGWGAQCRLAAASPGRAKDFARQESYDEFLATLERHDIVPGTVVIDDKWQAAYGTNRPDTSKWEDLRGWIERRHEAGQHLLLWWKAWDAEGLPPDLCIRRPDGASVGIDPTNPAAREALHESIVYMLGPAGLDADGLKVDFTARTPSGRALSTHGDGWGIALLHELLAIVYAAAKEAKPDALVITHTPHPAFADVTDMVRLNDMLRLDDPGSMPPVVPQMRYRAAVVRAACPELLIDTDDWTVPDKATWREYLELKPDLGVPSLYYVTDVDLTGERLDEDDYAAIRRTWARWRERLPT
jgi:hypothetical protein